MTSKTNEAAGQKPDRSLIVDGNSRNFSTLLLPRGCPGGEAARPAATLAQCGRETSRLARDPCAGATEIHRDPAEFTPRSQPTEGRPGNPRFTA